MCAVRRQQTLSDSEVLIWAVFVSVRLSIKSWPFFKACFPNCGLLAHLFYITPVQRFSFKQVWTGTGKKIYGLEFFFLWKDPTELIGHNIFSQEVWIFQVLQKISFKQENCWKSRKLSAVQAAQQRCLSESIYVTETRKSEEMMSSDFWYALLIMQLWILHHSETLSICYD